MKSLSTAKNNPLGIYESIGPFLREKFPLLKTQKKENEFFVRVDSVRIVQWFTDNGEVKNDFFFYPSDHLLDQFQKNYISQQTWEYQTFMELKKTGKGSFHPQQPNNPKRLRKKNNEGKMYTTN